MFVLVKKVDEQQVVRRKQNTLSYFISKLSGYNFDKHLGNHDLSEVLMAFLKEYLC